MKKKVKRQKRELLVIEKPEIKEDSPEEQQTLALFGKCSPAIAIKKAVELADVVADIIKKRRLFTLIKGRAYVYCEGWTTMGALLGIFAHVVEVIDLSNQEIGLKRYVADCQIKNLQGQIISQAQSECSNDEESKKNYEDYAIRSMAETRAVSKALRLALGWIMKLTGYEPTPAEEVDEKHITEQPIKDGNDNPDQELMEMEKAVPKLPEDTNKVHRIKQIRWILERLNISEEEFLKRIKKGEKEIAGLGVQSEDDLNFLRNKLWGQFKHGITLPKTISLAVQ